MRHPEDPVAVRQGGLEPPRRMVPIPYAATFSATDYCKIRRGFLPHDVEDRWLIFVENDDLFVHRASGPWPCVYHVQFRAADHSYEVAKAEIAERLRADMAHDVRLLDFLIRAALLEEDLDYNEHVQGRQ